MRRRLAYFKAAQGKCVCPMVSSYLSEVLASSLEDADADPGELNNEAHKVMCAQLFKLDPTWRPRLAR